jgi:hypothetical protein
MDFFTKYFANNLHSIDKHVLDYSHKNVIVENDNDVYLPEPPIEFKKIKIINLGITTIKIISNKNIYHTFFSPKGTTYIFLQPNDFLEFFYVKKHNGEGLWITK